MKKRVVLLGATGSIGLSTLDIIRHFPQRFELTGCSYHINEAKAKSIQCEFPSAYLACTKSIAGIDISTDTSSPKISNIVEKKIDFFKCFFDKTKPDIVVNGISGAAGLPASFAACNMGCNLALANKESIVLAYGLLKDLSNKFKAKIIPVDSEHWAIFQLLNMRKKEEIAKIIITASGGAFRDMPRENLKNVSLESSFNHPTWNMGKKITIDSATLANKALEVIEATKLFSLSISDIVVVVHKESIVHSMIQTVGGTVYADMSPPNMKVPILGALVFPEIMPKFMAPLDFTKDFSLSFSPPRYKDFPMLDMGFEVAKNGMAYPVAFNAANEMAVNAFMQKKISFLDIADIVEETLKHDWKFELENIESVFQADYKARKIACKNISLFE